MMIAVIRLKGKLGLAPRVVSTFVSLNLNRLYTCTLIPDNEVSRGMLRVCKDWSSFGTVDEPTIEKLLLLRGSTRDGKKLRDIKKPEEIATLAKEIATGDKPLSQYGILPIFFLAPPRGGFDGNKKAPSPFGPLGKNPKICKLIAQMA